MEIGRIGMTGIYVASHVLVEPRVDRELVPIPRHDMEAENAAERAKTYNLAMKIHAQVKKNGFLLVAKSISSLNILHLIDPMYFLLVYGNAH